MKKLVKIKRLYGIEECIDILMGRYGLRYGEREIVSGVFGMGLGFLYGLPKEAIMCYAGERAKVTVLDDSDFIAGLTKSIVRMKATSNEWTIRDVLRIVLRQIDKNIWGIEDFINGDDKKRKTILMGQRMIRFLEDNKKKLKPWGEFEVRLLYPMPNKKGVKNDGYNQFIRLDWRMPKDRPHWSNTVLNFIMDDCYGDSRFRNESAMRDFYILRTMLKADIEEVDRYVRTFRCMLDNFPHEDYPAFRLVDGGLTLKNWNRGDCAIDLLADDNGFIGFDSIDKLDLSLGLIAGR